MFHNSDRHSLWISMGSTIRIAQSQGLHRDGSGLGLTPFKVEMRRRLWWYILGLDQRLTELIGAESCVPQSTDTLLPCNCNDSDLKPDMTETPAARSGATEMTFCLSKYEIIQFLYYERGGPPSTTNITANTSSQSSSSANPSTNKSASDKERRTLSDLESSLEERFLRFCDPVVPVQFLATMITRSTICKLRQMTLHQIARPPNNNVSSSSMVSHQETRPSVMTEQANRAFQMAGRNLEYDNLIHSTRSLRGFLWHVHFFTPWGAPVYVLKILAGRGDWDHAMQTAWAQIEELYEHHQEYMESDTDIHMIIRGLTLQAWSVREAYIKSNNSNKDRPPPPLPSIIPLLQERQREVMSHKHHHYHHHHMHYHTGMSQNQHQNQNQPQQNIQKGATLAYRNPNENEVPYFPDLSGLDPMMYSVPEFIDPLFVAGEWANWAI
jgi:Fungal specific transcription factor domain